MSTVGEVIQRVQSIYSKGVQSDDSRLTPMHIYSKALTVRSKLVIQRQNKNRKVSQWLYQTLDCVELIVASINECPCLPPAGCKTYRSKYKIPKPLHGKMGDLIQSVTSLDGSIVYDRTSLKNKKYKKGNKYTAVKPEYYIHNDYLFITDKVGPKVITLVGLFDKPEEADSFQNYCENTEDCVDCQDCTSILDKEFLIEEDLIDTLIQMCFEELVILFNQNKEDITNDTKDSNLNTTK